MTEVRKPIVSLNELGLNHWQRGSFFESRDASFGALLGLKDLGVRARARTVSVANAMLSGLATCSAHRQAGLKRHIT